MKYSFLAGLVLGFAGVAVAAAGYPWVQHARQPSATEVVPNGGRAEQFVVRLPSDRIAGFTAAGEEAAPAARPGRAAPLAVEQFKVRDIEGRVIGVAARHVVGAPDGADVAWVIAIPGRGTFMLADAVEGPGVVDAALERAGRPDGAAWEGEVDVDVVTRAAGDVAPFSAGTGEFATLDFGFSESWRITGVDAAGRLRGTIELRTVGLRGS